jgi:homoserine O-acetyltransferase
MFPTFMDALIPLASNPVEIAGRNRVWRKLLVDAIVTDPTWKDGDYTEPPRNLPIAMGFLLMATSAPLQWQKQFPTAKQADAWLADQIATRTKNTDANDLIYYFRASEDYDPSPHVGTIVAPLLAINSADDFVNPPELPMMEALIAKVPRGRFILLTITDQTRGHGTHTLPAVWGGQLAEFLGAVRSRSPLTR